MKEIAQIEQKKIQGMIAFFAILVWCFRWSQGLLHYQLYQSPFISVEADNSFWLVHALQIPYAILHYQSLGMLLDLLWLVIAGVLVMQKSNRILNSLLVIILGNYFIFYNSIATHHEHTLIGLLMLSTLLLVKSVKNFVLLFVGLRYYVLFAFASAGLWKVFRGSLFIPNQMSEILKRQHLDYLIHYPQSTFSNFITFLIEQPSIANLFWYSGWIVELLFLVGFFTRRFDKPLGILFLAFFVLDYLLMNLCFIEFCIFVLVFYPWKGIWGYYTQQLTAAK